MRILAIGLAPRVFLNWLPGIEIIEQQGGEIAFLAFPRLNDPDAASMGTFLRERKHQIFPILDENGDEILDRQRILSIMRNYYEAVRPDIVLLMTCHMFPETSFIEAIKDSGRPAVVVGLQHGVYQPWEVYIKKWCFDYFFCFGDIYLRHFPEEMRSHIKPVGLPKLDKIKSKPRVDGDILFLAQHNPPPEAMRSLLCDLQDRMGLPVRIRPHLEHYSYYAALSDDFRFDPPNLGIEDSLAQASRVLSTASTAVLEALCVGRPTAVIRSWGDFDFEYCGLVATDGMADTIEAVWNKYQENVDFGELALQKMAAVGPEPASVRFMRTLRTLVKVDR